MRFCLTVLFFVLLTSGYSIPNREIGLYSESQSGSLHDSLLKKGDYKRLIEYNDSLVKSEEESKRNALRELELRKKAEAKEFEYRQLKQDREYNEKRNKLLLLIFILVCSGSLLFALYITSKETNMKRQADLMNAEKEEAKLKLKLNEEEAVKQELQKYEILSDLHMKEMELSGKIKDFEQLREEKELLDRKVENYRQSIEMFEQSADKSSGENEKLQKEIIEEITLQIKKHLPQHEECIRNIKRINALFIDNIMKVIDGNLSKQYLKYCICFATGMSIKDVSECCFVEQSSVHMIRYRLKKKFNLANDDDIDLYLKKLSL